MTHRLAFLLAACALAAAAGCYTGSATDNNRLPDDPTTTTDGTDPAATIAGGDGGAARVVAKADGLPCDVSAVITNACGDCHGAKPANGAKNRLVSYADFAAPSPGDPTQTVAQEALARMKSDDRPMPPSTKLADDAIAIFGKWVAAGSPKGACSDTDPNAGPTDPLPAAPDAGDPDAGPPPIVSVCTSGVNADPQAPASEEMKPGKACIGCHANHPDDAPVFQIAGTVYPTMHEPDLCSGAADVKILIIDAAGNVHTMKTNAAGNFTDSDPAGNTTATTGPIPFPYRAMIINGGNIRQMKTPQMTGDCNSCHTENGDGAPGRVRAP